MAAPGEISHPPLVSSANPLHPKTRWEAAKLIMILGILATVGPFAIDMYLPAFVQIADALETSTARVSLSLSSFFVGQALGQLFYGPLLDRFGRKPPLHAGLVLFMLASIGCMFAPNITVLVILRFIQALGGCSTVVATRAMVRDFFPVDESARVFSLMILMIGVSPLLAPWLGSVVTLSLGWQWIFLILAGFIGVILLISMYFLPEGHAPDPSVSLNPRPVLVGFGQVLAHPQFRTYALSGAFSFVTLYTYLAGSPVIFLSVYQVTPDTYGLIFGLLAFGFIGGNQLNILLCKRFHSAPLFQAGLLAQIICSLVFLILSFWQAWYGLPLAVLVGVLLCLLFSLGLTYPNASALALAPFEKEAGRASALIGFLQVGIAALVSSLIGWINWESVVPTAALMFVTALIALGILAQSGAMRKTPPSHS